MMARAVAVVVVVAVVVASSMPRLPSLPRSFVRALSLINF